MINSNYNYAESVWQDIFIFLEEKGYNVYPPDTATGICKEPYLVVKKSGGTKNYDINSNVDYYSIFCFVPKTSYDKLDKLVLNIKNDMKELFPYIRYADEDGMSYYDKEIEAHSIEILFLNYKK